MQTARKSLPAVAGEVTHLRCSSLPEAMICAGTVRGSDELLVEHVHEGGALGTAVHEALRPVVEHGIDRLGDLDLGGLAARHGVERDDLAPLVRYGIDAWKEIADAFGPTPLTEVEVEAVVAGVRITGHIDVLGESGPEIRIADWKSGRVDRSYRDQILGYLALALIADPEKQAATGIVVWLREREVERYYMTRDDLPAWEERIRTQIVEWNGVYRAGSHCLHCRRSHNCEALRELARRDVAIFSGGDDVQAQIIDGLKDLPSVRLAELYRSAGRVEKLAKSFRESVKRLAIQSGPIDTGDGHVLAISESETRNLDTAKVWPILERHLTAEEMAQAVTVGLGRVEDIIAKKAGRGHGAAAKRALDAELREAGAVILTPSHRLIERRK